MVHKFIESNFAPIVVLGLILGLFLPQLASFHFLISYLLASIIFLTSLKVDFKVFFNYLKDYRFFGPRLFLIKIIFPLIVFYIVSLFSPELALGGLLIVAMPSAVSNIVISNLFKANNELTLSFTVGSHILSVLSLPLLVFIASGESVSFDYVSLGMSLAQVVLLPLLLSIIVKRYFWKKVAPYTKYSSAIAVFAIFAIVLIIASINRESFFEFHTFLNSIFFALVLVVLLFVVGLFLGKNRPNKLALSISAFRINASLALYLSNEFFPKEVVLVIISLQLIFDTTTAVLQWISDRYIK